MKHAKLREALRAKYGARNYRIDRNDQVYVYGTMPNSHVVGWWLMGDILGAELWMGLHDDIGGAK
jgi:hypothetical protein